MQNHAMTKPELDAEGGCTESGPLPPPLHVCNREYNHDYENKHAMVNTTNAGRSVTLTYWARLQALNQPSPATALLNTTGYGQGQQGNMWLHGSCMALIAPLVMHLKTCAPGVQANNHLPLVEEQPCIPTPMSSAILLAYYPSCLRDKLASSWLDVTYTLGDPTIIPACFLRNHGYSTGWTALMACGTMHVLPA